MSVFPPFGRLRQEDYKFVASLGCILRHCLITNNQLPQSPQKSRLPFVSKLSVCHFLSSPDNQVTAGCEEHNFHFGTQSGDLGEWSRTACQQCGKPREHRCLSFPSYSPFTKGQFTRGRAGLYSPLADPLDWVI
jgi:hypothetical protein